MIRVRIMLRSGLCIMTIIVLTKLEVQDSVCVCWKELQEADKSETQPDVNEKRPHFDIRPLRPQIDIHLT